MATWWTFSFSFLSATKFTVPYCNITTTVKSSPCWMKSGLNFSNLCFFAVSSVQFSHSVMSDSFQPCGLQHSRPPCPLPIPGAYWNSCPLSRWCHPTISSSVVPCPSCPQSLPASASFPMSQLFTWGGQSIGVSASALALQWKPRTHLF